MLPISTEVNNLNTARQNLPGQGTQTSAIVYAGAAPAYQAVTEEYDGSCWTEVGDLNTARYGPGGSGGPGAQAAALCFGGLGPDGGYDALTESWNGSAWTEIADMATARYYLAGSPTGTSDSALAVAGEKGSNSNDSEEYNDPAYTIKTVTVS